MAETIELDGDGEFQYVERTDKDTYRDGWDSVSTDDIEDPGVAPPSIARPTKTMSDDR